MVVIISSYFIIHPKPISEIRTTRQTENRLEFVFESTVARAFER